MADEVPKPTLSLSVAEAVRAICFDFRQYAPQTLLFAGLVPLLTDNMMFLKREVGKSGAWVNRTDGHQMQWFSGSELIDFMCELASTATWDAALAARVCSRVFQTRVTPCPPAGGPKSELIIETGMEAFSCRQCGRCCRTLNYRDELTVRDVMRWRFQQRHDILKWVGAPSGAETDARHRIWVSPKTHRFLPCCPFLEKNATSNTWQCLIQETKPDICRQYPTSRKHGVMTGCKGFITHGQP